ncbi:lactose transport system permease protein LacF [mine drainage metagenome]|uniref:Lactose transport system permease protein LacF n=1 Tax=mine drainage metagenome TaxID=410659 RepID=A0A1J5QP59_9ZZZZ
MLKKANPLGRERRRTGFLFALPAFVLVAAILGIPIFQAMYYSMTTWDGITATWVGPSAIIHELKSPIFWRVIENNAYLLLAVPVAIIIPMGIAFLLNERVSGWKIFRTIYFLPTAISWVVIGMVSVRFFSQEGLLNSLLASIGLGATKTDLLSSEKGALLAVGVTFIWSMVGTNTIIFLTGMATLDPSLHEAAKMDGANEFRIFRSITVPQLRRFIQFSFIITIISAFTALFSLIFVMTGGGPGFGTTTLEFFVYQSAFAKGDFGTGALLGVILFVIMAGLGAAQLVLTRAKE